VAVGSRSLVRNSLHRVLLPNKICADIEPPPTYPSKPFFSLTISLFKNCKWPDFIVTFWKITFAIYFKQQCLHLHINSRIGHLLLVIQEVYLFVVYLDPVRVIFGYEVVG
jgi:hypothetical protein